MYLPYPFLLGLILFVPVPLCPVPGNPERVIELLSKNYLAVAQMANLMAEWLILAGAEITAVQQRVENHLHDMILKTFDPKKADAIFAEEGETPSWLAELIEYPTWRSLIYRLAEDYPDCLMLNFTIKLISDAGFQVGRELKQNTFVHTHSASYMCVG